jgi:hypothetical protein
VDIAERQHGIGAAGRRDVIAVLAEGRDLGVAIGRVAGELGLEPVDPGGGVLAGGGVVVGGIIGAGGAKIGREDFGVQSSRA